MRSKWRREANAKRVFVNEGAGKGVCIMSIQHIKCPCKAKYDQSQPPYLFTSSAAYSAADHLSRRPAYDERRRGYGSMNMRAGVEMPNRSHKRRKYMPGSAI